MPFWSVNEKIVAGYPPQPKTCEKEVMKMERAPSFYSGRSELEQIQIAGQTVVSQLAATSAKNHTSEEKNE